MESANLLIGTDKNGRSNEAWRQVYRSLDHKPTKQKCESKHILRKFPQPIVAFATLFVAMQIKRHAADYDPTIMIAKSIVANDLTLVAQAITDFGTASTRDRRAFCTYILFKERT